jgi:hypothetical protein
MASWLSSLDFWEYFEYSATAIVFLAAAGEYCAEFARWPEERGRKERLAKVSTLVLVIALAGELLGVVRTSQLSGQMIASLGGQSAQAGAKAEEAKVVSGKLTKENLLLQADVLRLQAAVATRHLDGEQRKRIALKLRRFAGLGFNLFGYAPDQETVGIANEILVVLSRTDEGAGWKESVSSGNIAIGWVTGIDVLVKPDADASSKAAARALVSALRAEHLAVTGPREAADHTPPLTPPLQGKIDPANPITIVIGKRR